MKHFNIGDWVVPKAGEEKFQGPQQIKDKEVNEQYLIGNFWYSRRNFEKWVPKIGEYCWFYNSKTDYHFGKLQSANIGIDGLNVTEYYSQEIYKRFDFCEPFTGNVPEFLKTNS